MKKLSIPLFIALFLLGCADKPKSIGNNLIPPGDMFNFAETTFTAVNDSVFRIPIVNGYASSNLVGKLSGGEDFVTLLQFYALSSVDSLKGATIDTAELRLTVNYRMLPASPPIQFTVYELQNQFSEGTFTSDSLTPTLIGMTPVGTFSDSMNFAQQVTARIDTAVVRKWADDFLDTSKPAFYGFAIRATGTSGVIGFSPFNYYSSASPLLMIKFTRNGRHDSISFNIGQDTFVDASTVPQTYTPLEVRGGSGVRADIKFTITSLPEKPIVNNATMILTVDTVASVYSGFSPDSLIATLTVRNNTTDSSLYAYGFKKTGSNGEKTYEFNCTQIVQRWLSNLSANGGLTIRWAAENSTSEKIIFYPVSDAVRGPKLKIFYAEKNQ